MAGFLGTADLAPIIGGSGGGGGNATTSAGMNNGGSCAAAVVEGGAAPASSARFSGGHDDEVCSCRMTLSVISCAKASLSALKEVEAECTTKRSIISQ